jgi:hypothetical protein
MAEKENFSRCSRHTAGIRTAYLADTTKECHRCLNPFSYGRTAFCFEDWTPGFVTVYHNSTIHTGPQCKYQLNDIQERVSRFPQSFVAAIALQQEMRDRILLRNSKIQGKG